MTAFLLSAYINLGHQFSYGHIKYKIAHTNVIWPLQTHVQQDLTPYTFLSIYLKQNKIEIENFHFQA